MSTVIVTAKAFMLLQMCPSVYTIKIEGGEGVFTHPQTYSFALLQLRLGWNRAGRNSRAHQEWERSMKSTDSECSDTFHCY